MGKNNFEDEDEENYDEPPTPVIDLPYYETLRAILEPYQPADDEGSADKTFTSAEIIRSIEEHHGVPQGPVAKGDVNVLSALPSSSAGW